MHGARRFLGPFFANCFAGAIPNSLIFLLLSPLSLFFVLRLFYFLARAIYLAVLSLAGAHLGFTPADAPFFDLSLETKYPGCGGGRAEETGREGDPMACFLYTIILMIPRRGEGDGTSWWWGEEGHPAGGLWIRVGMDVGMRGWIGCKDEGRRHE